MATPQPEEKTQWAIMWVAFGGGIVASILSGEGLVCKFSGTGKLWIQTRNPQGFGEAIGSKLPMREH